MGCSSSFETVAELEEHELLGNHNIIIHSDLSNMDQVKKMFVQKMKGNLQTHTQRLVGANETEKY